MHTYEIKFIVRDQLGQDLNFDPLQNLHAKVKELTPLEDGRNCTDDILILLKEFGVVRSV
jgi:hypothetical protein